MLTLFRSALGALTIIKVGDIVIRGNERMSLGPYLILTVLWFLAGVSIMMG